MYRLEEHHEPPDDVRRDGQALRIDRCKSKVFDQLFNTTISARIHSVIQWALP
jgi:hypothetical protein